MKPTIAFCAALLALGTLAAQAADATHPYSNVDHRNDAGNNTGDSQTDQLNAQELQKIRPSRAQPNADRARGDRRDDRYGYRYGGPYAYPYPARSAPYAYAYPYPPPYAYAYPWRPWGYGWGWRRRWWGPRVAFYP